MNPDTTILIPIYNEADLVRASADKMVAFMQKNPQFQFLFINDGSSDDTRQRIESTLKQLNHTQLGMISYIQNQGKGHAVKAGVSFCETPYLGFTDADLAYSLDHLIPLRDALINHEMVIGSRSMGSDNARNIRLIRRIMGKTFNLLARLILHLPYTDTQAGLKGFQRDAANAIFSRMRLTGFSFDVELIYLARVMGYGIKEIPARVNEQHSDKSSKVKLIRDSLKMFLALMRVRWNHLTDQYQLETPIELTPPELDLHTPLKNTNSQPTENAA